MTGAVTGQLATQVATTVAVAFLSAMLQRASGFGFALFATPLLSFSMPVTLAVIVVSLVAFPAGLTNLYELRSHVDRYKVRWIVLWSLFGMPLGLLAHRYVSDRAMRVVLAAAVIVAALLLFSGARIRSHHAKRADAVAGFLSGVLNTSTGTNGPPLVAVLAGQDTAPDTFRANLAAIFTSSGVIAIALFAIDGLITQRSLVLFLAGLPMVFAGRYFGATVAKRLDAESFRRLVLGLLLATGAMSAIRAFI
jgi:uncharacterized protein